MKCEEYCKVKLFPSDQHLSIGSSGFIVHSKRLQNITTENCAWDRI